MTTLASLLLVAPVQAHYRVTDQTLARVDARVFGHFMERPSWGDEIGVEGAVVPGTHRLQAGVVAKLKELAPPVLRFPHGTDNDYTDWRDMVSNVPGRGSARPVTTGHLGGKVTNRFGYDEFLDLAKGLRSEVILPVRFRDAVLGLADPAQEAEIRAAALAAYVNAPVGKDLPGDLEKWANLRLRNGHRAPWKVRTFQIGNETWAWEDEFRKRYGDRADARYVDVVDRYVRAIHAVDPTIRIIVDGTEPSRAELIRRRLGKRVHYLADHLYAPWEINGFKRDGRDVPTPSLSRLDIWNAWTSVYSVDARGLAWNDLNAVRTAPRHGYPVAVTEWNWNGWWGPDHWRVAKLDSQMAKALGAAGMLHGMMRRAGVVKMATMSMTVGKHWEIDAIRYSPDGAWPAYFMPTGQVVMLYRHHHGPRLLKTDALVTGNTPQPFQVTFIPPKARLATVDALATGDGKRTFLHAINRAFDRSAVVRVDPPRGVLWRTAVVRSLVGPLQNQRGTGRIVTQVVKLGPVPRVSLPLRSVSVVEFRP